MFMQLQRREKREHIDAITLKLLNQTPKKQRLDVSYLLDKKRQQKKPHVVDVWTAVPKKHNNAALTQESARKSFKWP